MESVDWTRFGLPSSLEIGKDGFPHPGKATHYYREQKKCTDATWTQKHLAQELGLTERAVCYLESHDVGLDSISLRRRLAMLFTIPPISFGLASLESETDPGQIIRQYRKLKPKKHPLSSQKGLARSLSITDKAVRDMEKRNVGLDSITRRRVLALLLDIPPATLGIITFEEILLQQQKVVTTIPPARAKREKEARFDLAFYRDRLKTFWNRNHATSAQDQMKQLTANMDALTTTLPYVSGEDEKEIRVVLCYYLQLHAHILRDQGRYDVAIAELEKAAILAERVENLPLLAVTLLRVGSVLRDRGDVIMAQAKIEAARGNGTGANQKRIQANADYMAAIDCYTRIRNLKRIPKALHGVLLFDEGYAQEHLAYDQKARRTALARFEDGGKIIAATRDILEEEFSIRITERTYHNTKAAVLLKGGWPREALQELTDLMDLPEEGDMARQNAYTDYLWSQAYADLGLIDASATPAQDALVVMKRIKSRIHMMRIAGLQGQLSQLDSRHIEVIRLGVMVH